jgi:hypothetical protein
MNMTRVWRLAGRSALAVIVGAGLIAGPATTVQASGAWTDVSEYFLVAARHSDRCLDVSGNSQSNGAKLQQYWCHEGLNQQWRLVFTGLTDEYGGPWYELQVASSHKCIDIEGASTGNRARAQQYTCHGGDNQLFRLVDVSYDYSRIYYELVAKHSGKCLDVEGDLVTDNAKVWQYTCDEGYNQQWALVRP